MSRKSTSPFDRVLDELKAGRALFIPYSSHGELQRIRIGLARRAASDKITLEFRVKRCDEETGELGVRIHATESDALPPTPAAPD